MSRARLTRLYSEPTGALSLRARSLRAHRLRARSSLRALTAYGHRSPTGFHSLRARLQPTVRRVASGSSTAALVLFCSVTGGAQAPNSRQDPGRRRGRGSRPHGPGKTKGPKGLARGRGATWQSWGIRASRALRRPDREDDKPIPFHPRAMRQAACEGHVRKDTLVSVVCAPRGRPPTHVSSTHDHRWSIPPQHETATA